MRVWIALLLIVGTSSAISLGLYMVRDQHFGISNVCLPIYSQCR